MEQMSALAIWFVFIVMIVIALYGYTSMQVYELMNGEMKGYNGGYWPKATWFRRAAYKSFRGQIRSSINGYTIYGRMFGVFNVEMTEASTLFLAKQELEKYQRYIRDWMIFAARPMNKLVYDSKTKVKAEDV